MNDTVRADDLIQHASFVRHLAEDLVGRSGGEDVVQEAYVRALERPPREQNALRGWLAIVVANLARNARRGERRRDRREERAAASERIDSNELALERLEIQRVIGELVVALPEEQRTVVYLRYFEDLTPSAIAERLGVPVKTVKSRHTRALARLRELLDERSSGDRLAWVSALAPWVRATTPVAATSSWVLPVAVAGILLLSVGTWLATRTARVRAERAPVAALDARAGESSASPTPEVESTPRSGAREERAATRPAAEAAPSDLAVLSGQVTLGAGGPALAGIEVEVAWRGSAGVRRASATTDAAGAFRFEWREPLDVLRAEAHCSASTASLRRELGLRLAPGTSETHELAVTSGATLAGTVVDTEGRPVPGARLLGWCCENETTRAPDRVSVAGPDGSFRIERFGAGFHLLAEAPGLVCRYGLRGEVAAGVVGEDLRLVMSTGSIFRGHVVDTAGRPIAGAVLSRGWGGQSSADGTHVQGVQRFFAGSMRATSDASGAFELGPYPLERSSVRVTHPGFLMADVDLDAALADHTLVLDAGHRLSGTVTGWDGRAVSGAEVTVGSGAQGWTQTDEQGRFELAPLTGAENAFVHVAAAGHALWVAQPVRIGPATPPLDVRLEPPLALAGRVVDREGNPVPDALVRLEGERVAAYDDFTFDQRTTWEWVAGRSQTRTDVAGLFRFDDLHAGEFELIVSSREQPHLRARLRARSGSEELVIVIDPAALARVSFAGRVVDGLTHEVLRDFTFLVHRPVEAGERERTDRLPSSQIAVTTTSTTWMGSAARVELTDDGFYRVTGVDPGMLLVEVKAEGYAPWRGEAREYPEGPVALDVELYPTCALQLTARSTGERTLSASVKFFDLDGRALRVALGTSGATDTVEVDGTVRAFQGLPRKPIRLVASASGHLTLTRELDLTLPPSDALELVLQPDPEAARVRVSLAILFTADEGRLETEEGEPLRAAFEAGEITPPDEPVSVEFLDRDGNVQAVADVRPLAAFRYASSCRLGAELHESEHEGPVVDVELPTKVVAARLRAPGCRERTVPLEGAQRGFVILLRNRR